MKLEIDFNRKRTKYAYGKVYQRAAQLVFTCLYLETAYDNGFTRYTTFKDSYRKYGPAIPGSIMYKRLKTLRTSIERNYGLVKENRYRMEYMNTYMVLDNVAMHVIEHDIVLTQDIIFDYCQSGETSPLIKVHY